VLGTGLVAIPVTPTKTLPIVSYQHGTVFGREEVPSMLANSYETMASVAVFASQGFVVTGADYFGLGGSTQAPNSYGVPGSTEQACLDMLKAARAVMKAEGLTPSQLFVNGWSQGGYNTLRFLKRLEMAGEPVTAASTASAPTDVHLWIGRLLTNPQPGDAIWLVGCASNLMMAADSYSAPGFAASVIRPEYMDSARRFYTFQMSWPEYAKTLPATLQDYFKPEFLASFRYGTNPFWEKLDASENYRWAVQTPLRNYYGEADEAIPVDIALMPSRVAKLLGTGTTAVSAGPKADHRATYLYSLTELPAWYRSFMK
jgi:pimeloyl-ACP methyl ester carboxylesterase